MTDGLTENELLEWEEQDAENTQGEDDSQEDVNFDTVRVVKSNQDYNLDYLISSIDKNIDLGPDYQRRSRWSKAKQSMLIESFLMNIPVPPIFLYEKDYYEYEVIDGRQRLEAINSFIKNEFKLTKLKYLKNIEGKRFRELEDQIQKSLYRRTISATILLVESKTFDKYDLRMILFNRLNTGGEKLNGQELRNAIYASQFNDLVMELSSIENFKKMWSIPVLENSEDKTGLKKLKNNTLYKTMTDCELVLRFFAVKKVYENLINSGSMKLLLDETMKQNLKLPEEEINGCRNVFTGAVDGIMDHLGESGIINPILATPKRARNLYDSMLVAFCSISAGDLQSKEIILKNIENVLKNDDDYERIITKGNSIENIRYRVDKAKEILTSIID